MENSNNIYQMRAVTRHIEGVPEEWQSINDWDSHRPLLWLAVKNSYLIIIEMGCGFGSTDLLHKYKGGQVVSYETNKEWVDKFENALWVEDYVGDIAIPYKKISLLFVDAAPGEIRKDIIKKWADAADVIVVHDTEPGAEYVYGMKEILSTFKYRLDYQPEGMPHTTAVSNTVNVCTWI